MLQSFSCLANRDVYVSRLPCYARVLHISVVASCRMYISPSEKSMHKFSFHYPLISAASRSQSHMMALFDPTYVSEKLTFSLTFYYLICFTRKKNLMILSTVIYHGYVQGSTVVCNFFIHGKQKQSRVFFSFSSHNSQQLINYSYSPIDLHTVNKQADEINRSPVTMTLPCMIDIISLVLLQYIVLTFSYHVLTIRLNF